MAAGKEAERHASSPQRAAGSLERDPGAQQHDRPSLRAAASASRSQSDAELGEEVVARSGRLGLRLVAGRTVETHRAAADEDRRRGGRRLECGGQAAGRQEATVVQLRFALRASSASRRSIRPARLISAADPSRTARPRYRSCRRDSSRRAVTPGTPVPGSCRVSPAISDRVSTRTSCPSSAYISARGLPRKPVPPAMTIFIPVCLTNEPVREFAL